MKTKFCKDCRFFKENLSYFSISWCEKPDWRDLITGKLIDNGAGLRCWEARQKYCGITAVGFEEKESELK